MGITKEEGKTPTIVRFDGGIARQRVDVRIKPIRGTGRSIVEVGRGRAGIRVGGTN